MTTKTSSGPGGPGTRKALHIVRPELAATTATLILASLISDLSVSKLEPLYRVSVDSKTKHTKILLTVTYSKRLPGRLRWLLHQPPNLSKRGKESTQQKVLSMARKHVTKLRLEVLLRLAPN